MATDQEQAREAAREWVGRAEARIAQDIHFGGDDEVAKYGRVLIDALDGVTRDLTCDECGHAEFWLCHGPSADRLISVYGGEPEFPHPYRAKAEPVREPQSVEAARIRLVVRSMSGPLDIGITTDRLLFEQLEEAVCLSLDELPLLTEGNLAARRAAFAETLEEYGDSSVTRAVVDDLILAARAVERAAVRAAAAPVGSDWPDGMTLLGELMDAAGVGTDGRTPPRDLWRQCVARVSTWREETIRSLAGREDAVLRNPLAPERRVPNADSPTCDLCPHSEWWHAMNERDNVPYCIACETDAKRNHAFVAAPVPPVESDDVVTQ